MHCTTQVSVATQTGARRVCGLEAAITSSMAPSRFRRVGSHACLSFLAVVYREGTFCCSCSQVCAWLLVHFMNCTRRYRHAVQLFEQKVNCNGILDEEFSLTKNRILFTTTGQMHRWDFSPSN